ncbi:MAG: hypothetical protein HYW86_01250 [Candidatus Roizmanbacteria bacterium]|nr:MAG: hypothetical protein HYW86_01250 [Candidatus Roizmanbacteria bacterium]
MSGEQLLSPVKTFQYEGKSLPVSHTSTLNVTTGVECDVYQFVGDQSKDLGVIRIQPGCKTPLQKVLKGDKTVEGYISGKGKLIITKPNGEKYIYEVSDKLEKPLAVLVEIGELMQWEADKESDLKAYEVCYPPYEDGRYENIE